MKSYQGRRFGHETVVVVVENGVERALPMRLGLHNHSPTGFEWGYAGSGPAQLALAILADALGDDSEALLKHQLYKQMVVARLDRDHWTLTHDQVIAAARKVQA